MNNLLGKSFTFIFISMFVITLASDGFVRVFPYLLFPIIIFAILLFIDNMLEENNYYKTHNKITK